MGIHSPASAGFCSRTLVQACINTVPTSLLPHPPPPLGSAWRTTGDGLATLKLMSDFLVARDGEGLNTLADFMDFSIML